MRGQGRSKNPLLGPGPLKPRPIPGGLGWACARRDQHYCVIVGIRLHVVRVFLALVVPHHSQFLIAVLELHVSSQAS